MSILKTGNVLLAPERKIQGMEKGSKADRKLFRERLPKWQENYLEHLIKEYMEILSSDGAPSDRFWALEERIKKDRRHPGVMLSTGDSPVIYTIIDLMRWNVYLSMILKASARSFEIRFTFCRKNYSCLPRQLSRFVYVLPDYFLRILLLRIGKMIYREIVCSCIILQFVFYL